MKKKIVFFWIFLNIALISCMFLTVSGEIVLEHEYTVTTVIDGNKLGINPHSVLTRSRPSDLVILDSTGNSFFTVSFPLSQDITRLSGNGAAGFSDGDSTSAMFNRPRSFAVDTKGNVYVADKNNHVIRKISKTGVTTIAGGYSQKTGHTDGPAQNASFSDDFELTFAPQICALLISDHGSKVIRQIILKQDDCAGGSRSVLGATAIWLLGLGVSCMFGLIVGFVFRPYIIPHDGSRDPFFNMTWKHCLINLGKQIAILCFDVRNATASSTLYLLLKKLLLLSLSQLYLMHSMIFVVDLRPPHVESVSLLDSDESFSCEMKPSQMYADQLKDLVSFDGSLELSDTSNQILKQGDDNQEKSDVFFDSNGRIDDMIQANVMGFVEATKKTIPQEGSFLVSSELIKRR